MTLKVKIEALDYEAEIEIKKDGDLYRLIVIKSKSAYYKHNGKAWHGQTAADAQIKEITGLVEECYVAPTKTKMICILDCTVVTFLYDNDKTKINYSIKDFEEGAKQDMLMAKLYELCNKLTGEIIFKKF
ncbi:MAG: vinculin [Bacteroidetes bacterium]|jgi:hypothetical protein|nr:vinculin [Bacteroidota bacterium]